MKTKLKQEICLLFFASCLLSACGGGAPIGGGPPAGGGSPGVSFSAKSLTFGDEVVHTVSQPSSVTLTNSGSAPLTIAAIAASASFAQTNNCGSSVAAGAACSINVTFTPTAIGNQTGSITVSDNASGNSQTVTLSGTGIGGSMAVLSPTFVTFGSQLLHTISASQNIGLTNTGGSPLSITNISIGGANSGDFSQTNTCGNSLAAGAACTISVQFEPGASGTRLALISVTDNASGSPQSVSLSGTAPNPVPYLQQPLAPMTAAPGGLGLTLTLHGAGFVPGSSVMWNGSSRAVTFISSNALQAFLLPSDVATAGTSHVVITNPAPGGGKSNPQPFHVTISTSSVAMSTSVLPVSTDPRGVIAADFNGDGKPDIAVVNRGTNTVSILLGNGENVLGGGQLQHRRRSHRRGRRRFQWRRKT